MICCDEGQFLRAGSDVDYVEDYLDPDLASADCFETIELAIEFCAQYCKPGWKVLSNACTAIEITHYTKE